MTEVGAELTPRASLQRRSVFGSIATLQPPPLPLPITLMIAFDSLQVCSVPDFFFFKGPTVQTCLVFIPPKTLFRKLISDSKHMMKGGRRCFHQPGKGIGALCGISFTRLAS